MPILIGSLTFLLIIATTVTIAQSTQNCDPAYPKDLARNEICIPSPPPDLDCKDISSILIKMALAVKDVNSISNGIKSTIS